MHILAIDPGTKHSGAVLASASLWAHSGHAARVLRAWPDFENERLLARLRERAGWVAGGDYVAPSHVVIEALSPRGQVIGWSTFHTIEWVGRLREAAAHRNGEEFTHVIHRDDIRLELLGRANTPGADKHIRQVLLDEIGPKGTKKAPGPTYGCSRHSWAALAAMYAWWRIQRRSALLAHDSAGAAVS